MRLKLASLALITLWLSACAQQPTNQPEYQSFARVIPSKGGMEHYTPTIRKPYNHGIKAIAFMMTKNPDALEAQFIKTGIIKPELGPFVKMNESVYSAIIFEGCQTDNQGKCQLDVDLYFITPDGKKSMLGKNIELWQRAPLKQRYTLGTSSVKITIEATFSPGRYSVQAAVHDRIAKQTFYVENLFGVVPNTPD